MALLPAQVEHLVAWGQYMHWAQLQFQRFYPQSSDATDAEKIGIAAHWLAAEYVVFEGWRELGLHSQRIARLLAAYPENQDLLRRCRNAVYHFQRDIIDPRIGRMLEDTTEELRWSIALHFEFQGVLLQLSDDLRLNGPLGRVLAQDLARAIGWFPTHPYAERIAELETLCIQFEALVGVEQSPEADEARAFIASARKEIKALDMYPLSSALSRLVRAHPPAPSGAA